MRNEKQRRFRWLAIAAIAACVGLWIERSEVDADRAQQGLASAGSAPDAGERSRRDAAAVALDAGAAANGPDAIDRPLELAVRADGAPKSGAQVRLWRIGERDPNTGQLVWTAAGSGETGADGVARLAAPAGRYLAMARLEGYAAGFAQVSRPLGEQVTRAQLELPRGAVLVGKTLLRGTKEPVPLAQLVCTPSIPGLRAGEAPAEAKLSGASDANGRFSLAGMAPGLWQIEARAAGSGRASARAVRVPRDGPLVLELVASSYLEGHVLAPDGSPAPLAELTARQGDASEHATSSDSGAFSIELSPGAWKLSARRGTEAAALPHAVAVAEGETQRGLELRLGQGAAIAGSVVHRGDKAPLAGARIAVSPHDENGDSGRALTGADGKFAVEGLAPGSYDVVVERQGAQRLETRGVALGAGQRFEKLFELGGTGAVEGVVSDAQGRPIEGALLECSGSALAVSLQARSGPDGGYRLKEVASASVQLSARRPQAQLGTARSVVVREGETTHADFTLAATGHVAGKVARAHGPLPDGVTVSALGRGPAPGFDSTSFASTPVAPDGTYQLELPAGAYDLFASGDGARMSSRARIAVEADETLTRDLLLPDASESGLTVQVLEPGGAPSLFAQVALRAAGGARGFASFGTTDSSGQFAVDRPRSDLPDDLQVLASNGARQGTATAGPDAAAVTVQLQPAASLSGQLIDGTPINSFALTFQSSAPAQATNQTGTLQFVGDRFELPDTAPGSYTLYAVTSDGRTGNATATVEPGASAEVQIALSPATSLLGHAVDESGAALAGATVFIDRGASVQADADGSFRIDNVSPGAHHLSGAMAPALAADLDVQIAQGQQLDVGPLVFKLPKAAPGTVGITLRGDSSGVYVAAVTPGSPADQAGILPGDAIQSIDGVPCAGITDALTRIRGAPGTPVMLGLLRNASPLLVQVFRAASS